MNDIPPVKDRDRTEREKLSGLSFKEKIIYIWQYYNYYIVGIPIVVIMTISILRSCVMAPDVKLFIAWEGLHIEDGQLDDFENTLTERLFDSENGEIAQVTEFFPISDDFQIYRDNYDRLITMLFTGTIDMFIVNEKVLELYSAMEYLNVLDSLLEEVRSYDPQLYEILSDRAVCKIYANHEESDPDEVTERLVGINITDSPLLRELGFTFYVDAYLALSVLKESYDIIIPAIAELYK